MANEQAVSINFKHIIEIIIQDKLLCLHAMILFWERDIMVITINGDVKCSIFNTKIKSFHV